VSQAWIDIHDLRLERGGRLVLQGVNASLSGAAIGLVGANGAGKSTLIGALLGVLKPSSGSIRVLDLEIPARAMDLRARAGVMAEQAGVFPGGSGVDAVVFAGMLSGLSRRESLRRSHRALDALDVGEERYRPASGYSTGMKQRTKLAMSLVHDPEILILDEPTVGLDPMGRTQLLRLIRDLRDQGRRILLSTHVLQDAEAVCDEMLLLQGGVVAFSGGVRRLLGGKMGACWPPARVSTRHSRAEWVSWGSATSAEPPSVSCFAPAPTAISCRSGNSPPSAASRCGFWDAIIRRSKKQ